MIQVYVDDELIYDSRVKATALIGLKAQLGLNKGGAATIILPPEHPFYNAFTSYRSVVTIYRDGVLRFRGRALYPTDDFKLKRTITCEGERCFLRDGIHRPHTYTDTPKNIFTQVIGRYNAQVEAFKQFVVGTIEGISTDAIVLEIDEAEPFSSIVDKLVELCGGYIVFTTNHAGQRVINWYSKINYSNQQTIEFGENMMDFSRTSANSDLATVILPYGAKDETTGARLTIESVNGGLDFIKDDEAVALRGVIAKAVYWDEIVTPDALLNKAQQYLNNSKNLIVSLELTAIDLSLLDKNIDSFMVGDIIKVRSKPHGVDDELYQLTEQNLDFLHPQNDRVVLGKNIASLTGSDVASARKNDDSIKRLNKAIRADYAVNTDAIIETAKMEMSTLIQQTSESLMLEVSEQYATQNSVKEAITTTMTQLSDSFEFLFTELRTTVNANDADAREQFAEFKKFIRFENGNIVLGEAGNEITLRIENDRIIFLDDGAEVAYFTNKQLTVKDASFLNSMRIGAFAFLPRDNGNLSLVKVGD
jgi:phage minor structural protein